VSRNIRIGFFVVIVFLGVVWVTSIQLEPQMKTYSGFPEVNKPAPNFVLKNKDGVHVSLSSFKGKVVYLKFWASWCGDCIKQVIPQRKLEEALSAETKIAFLNISVDEDETKWRKSIARNKLYAVEVWSKNGEEERINENYSIDKIPRYILIGKDGIVLDNNAPEPSEIDADYFANYL